LPRERTDLVEHAVALAARTAEHELLRATCGADVEELAVEQRRVEELVVT
jgi:hypothetical protein